VGSFSRTAATVVAFGRRALGTQVRFVALVLTVSRSEVCSVNRVKSPAIFILALAFPDAVTTLAGLWKTSVLLRYVDIFVGKVGIADFLGVFGRSSLAVHL